jgi:hypothetical protein
VGGALLGWTLAGAAIALRRGQKRRISRSDSLVVVPLLRTMGATDNIIETSKKQKMRIKL